MGRFFNQLANYTQGALTAAPAAAAAFAYGVTKDPQFAAFTLMATSMGLPEASAHLRAAQSGFESARPKQYNGYTVS